MLKKYLYFRHVILMCHSFFSELPLGLERLDLLPLLQPFLEIFLKMENELLSWQCSILLSQLEGIYCKLVNISLLRGLVITSQGLSLNGPFQNSIFFYKSICNMLVEFKEM